jgi:hypothetical protein
LKVSSNCIPQIMESPEMPWINSWRMSAKASESRILEECG